jgi:hypothetical protein
MTPSTTYAAGHSGRQRRNDPAVQGCCVGPTHLTEMHEDQQGKNRPHAKKRLSRDFQEYTDQRPLLPELVHPRLQADLGKGC